MPAAVLLPTWNQRPRNSCTDDGLAHRRDVLAQPLQGGHLVADIELAADRDRQVRAAAGRGAAEDAVDVDVDPRAGHDLHHAHQRFAGIERLDDLGRRELARSCRRPPRRTWSSPGHSRAARRRSCRLRSGAAPRRRLLRRRRPYARRSGRRASSSRRRRARRHAGSRRGRPRRIRTAEHAPWASAARPGRDRRARRRRARSTRRTAPGSP